MRHLANPHDRLTLTPARNGKLRLMQDSCGCRSGLQGILSVRHVIECGLLSGLLARPTWRLVEMVKRGPGPLF